MVAPVTTPSGIAHHLPSPLDNAAPAAPPKIPPAILPSEQSLVSYSIVSLLEYPPWSLQGTSMFSFHDLIYPGLFAVPGVYSSRYS